MRKKGVEDLKRESGVGVDVAVEAQRNGSEEFEGRILHAEVGRVRQGAASEDEAAGRSSKDGGLMPNSVYSQSICIKVAESCVNRLD